MNFIIKNLHKNKIIILISILLIIFLIICILVCFYINQNSDIEQDYLIDNINSNVIIPETIENEKIKIHIAGEIINPGIYELKENSRISDAIEASGGLTSNANLNTINLAYILSDGQKIVIPSINEENNGNTIDEISEEVFYNTNNKININTASISELIKINGIGNSTAQSIIDYRKQNGKFGSIEDIKNIRGIGENKYNQIKDYIKVK